VCLEVQFDEDIGAERQQWRRRRSYGGIS